MDTNGLLLDAFGRVQGVVHRALEGLSADALTFRPDADANSIAWLVWHLTRVQDDHLADVAGTEQVWTRDGFFGGFSLPFAPSATGYAHRSADVAAVQVSAPDQLLGYHDAVHDETCRFIGGLGEADLDRIVDERWDPPVSLGVRLISVIADNLEHAGQAAYLRGMSERL